MLHDEFEKRKTKWKGRLYYQEKELKIQFLKRRQPFAIGSFRLLR
jgi:hypothetical protein